MTNRNFRYISDASKYILTSTSGNFAIMGALILPVLLVAAGGAVDVANAFSTKKDLQERLDAGVLSAAPQPAHAERQKRVEQFMATLDRSTLDDPSLEGKDDDTFISGSSALTVVSNPDGSVTGTYSVRIKPWFLGMIGMSEMPLSVTSTAYAEMKQQSQTCIYSLGNTPQNVLINSGAFVKSEKCGIDVYSTANPAFIMNSGSKIETSKFCVKGTNAIINGGTITNLEKGCTPAADPYAGKIPTPTMPSNCTTNGPQDGKVVRIKPGMHCNVNFNGSPEITFEPGLHIIRDTMNIGSNSTIKAEGVTFYFPNSNVELRMNGGVTTKMTAPTSGPYKGILMFETPTKQYGSRPFIFNGSKGETLEGVIYLPNRDVTYNSTTRQVSKIALVVNSMIINAANWSIEPIDGGASTTAGVARLVR